jgi:hypothetical protein
MVIWGSGPIMSKSSLSMIKDASITAEPPQDQKIKVRLGGTHLCGLTFLSFSLYIMKLYGFTLIKGIWENGNLDLKLSERWECGVGWRRKSVWYSESNVWLPRMTIFRISEQLYWGKQKQIAFFFLLNWNAGEGRFCGEAYTKSLWHSTKRSCKNCTPCARLPQSKRRSAFTHFVLSPPSSRFPLHQQLVKLFLLS